MVLFHKDGMGRSDQFDFSSSLSLLECECASATTSVRTRFFLLSSSDASDSFRSFFFDRLSFDSFFFLLFSSTSFFVLVFPEECLPSVVEDFLFLVEDSFFIFFSSLDFFRGLS